MTSQYAYHPPGFFDSSADYDWTSLIIGTLLVAGLTQQALSWLDFPILSIFELTWNAFVYLMPSPLILGLRSVAGPSPIPSSTTERSAPKTHAEKSQVLREVLRLGSGSPSTKKARIQYPTAPKGLGNWDNSCYQNSVLQALASLPSMQRFYAQIDCTLGGPPNDSTLAALRALGTQLNDVEGDSTYHWTPPTLKSMSSWTQQDAQEYFSKLVEAMEKDISGELKKLMQDGETAHLSLADLRRTLNPRKARDDKDTELEVADDADRAAGSALARAVRTPFEGLLAQRVGCTECGYTEGLSLIPFNCMTVPLGREANYPLAQCLNEFTELENIDGVECARCTLVQAKERLQALSKRIADDEPTGTEDDNTTERTAALERQQSIFATRLSAVDAALQEEDFSEAVLTDKCHLTKQHRKSSRKSRQAAVVRAPRCLVVHINRSMFDEQTGDLLKNHAAVQFPMNLDLAPWCVGESPSSVTAASGNIVTWETDPCKPLVYGANPDLPMAPTISSGGQVYRLKAVITHYGRHENGHYICYRQSPGQVMEEAGLAPGPSRVEDTKQESELADDVHRWWRLSDETVTPVTEDDIAAQGGAFMLFYEMESGSELARNVIDGQKLDLCAADVQEDVSSGEESLGPDTDATSQSADSVVSQTTLDADEKVNA